MIEEFTDRYSDHLVFGASATSASVVSEVWHIIPVEMAVLAFAALFVVAQVYTRHWLTNRLARRQARAAPLHGVPRKRRV